MAKHTAARYLCKRLLNTALISYVHQYPAIRIPTPPGAAKTCVNEFPRIARAFRLRYVRPSPLLSLNIDIAIHITYVLTLLTPLLYPLRLEVSHSYKLHTARISGAKWRTTTLKRVCQPQCARTSRIPLFLLMSPMKYARVHTRSVHRTIAGLSICLMTATQPFAWGPGYSVESRMSCSIQQHQSLLWASGLAVLLLLPFSTDTRKIDERMDGMQRSEVHRLCSKARVMYVHVCDVYTAIHPTTRSHVKHGIVTPGLLSSHK